MIRILSYQTSSENFLILAMMSKHILSWKVTLGKLAITIRGYAWVLMYTQLEATTLDTGK